MIIVSNRKCVSAIHLYRKFGFIEIPVDKTNSLMNVQTLLLNNISSNLKEQEQADKNPSNY